MSTRGEVLVAILNNRLDFNIAYERHWYRIPVRSVDRFLGKRWPPQWLAFYQTKAFGQEAHAVNYYTRVLDIREVHRLELFPGEPENPKSNQRYYQLLLSSLRPVPRPIYSRRLRRIVFIPTTIEKFSKAEEINDLYDGSPLEDKLWAEFKRRQILAERQEQVTVNKNNYLLDFALHCARGNVDVETDGDRYHANPEKAAADNVRNNDLATAGWQVLRFTTAQIEEQLEEYCLPNIVDTVHRLGDLDEGGLVPRKIDLHAPEGSRQLGLFDNL